MRSRDDYGWAFEQTQTIIAAFPKKARDEAWKKALDGLFGSCSWGRAVRTLSSHGALSGPESLTLSPLAGIIIIGHGIVIATIFRLSQRLCLQWQNRVFCGTVYETRQANVVAQGALECVFGPFLE
jgi:hypothetical protein